MESTKEFNSRTAGLEETVDDIFAFEWSIYDKRITQKDKDRFFSIIFIDVESKEKIEKQKGKKEEGGKALLQDSSGKSNPNT